MQRKNISLIAMIILTVFSCCNISKANVQQTSNITVAYGKCDVNGDKKEENIYLKVIESPMDVYLIIKDSNNQKVLLQKGLRQNDYLGENLEEWSLQFKDFNGDGIKEIMTIYKYIGSAGASNCGVYGFKANRLNVFRTYKEGGEDILRDAKTRISLKNYNSKYYLEITDNPHNGRAKLELRKDEIAGIQNKNDLRESVEYKGTRYSGKDIDGDGKDELIISRTLRWVNTTRYIAEMDVYYKYIQSDKWVLSGYKIIPEN